MEPALSTQSAPPRVPAWAELSENSRLGSATSNPALYPGHSVQNSTTALGLQWSLNQTRIGSRSTGKERDSESGNDLMGARYYSSAMGRFLSPDPLIPFNMKRDEFQAWIANPQHWNKYAYALNNPLKYTDPTGLTETIYYFLNKNLTDEQKKFFNDHKDAILGAIAGKLKEAGIKDVQFRDGSTLSSAQQAWITKNNPEGVAMLNIANKGGVFNNGTWSPDSGTYGGTNRDMSVVLMGNLQKGDPDASTLIYRLGEVGAHELGHGMGFFSCPNCQLEFWRNDLMDEGQGMPRTWRPGHFDMTIPQNKDAVDSINSDPPYNPYPRN